MKDSEVYGKQITLSDTEQKYKSFHKSSKFFAWLLVVPTVVLVLVLLVAKQDTVILISGLLLLVWTAVLIIACSLIGKKRTLLEEKLWQERNAVRRSGIFKELYEEFRHDGFEFNICSDKFLFDDCHRNIMECTFLKNSHEFSLLIDENAVSILADEETEHPKELVISLSEIESVGCFYENINEFVLEYSET